MLVGSFFAMKLQSHVRNLCSCNAYFNSSSALGKMLRSLWTKMSSTKDTGQMSKRDKHMGHKRKSVKEHT